MNYVVYDTATGEIRVSGNCSTELSYLVTVGPNQMLLEVVEDGVSAKTHYVFNNEPIAFSNAQLEARRTPPDRYHEWSNTTMQWSDPRLMAEKLSNARLSKLGDLNRSRLAANRSTFTFAGKQISCDELSRSDIDGVNGQVSITGALPSSWVGGWKAADNSYVSIPDVATWIGFYSAMVEQGQLNFSHSEVLKAAVLSADATVESINAIVW